MYPKVGIKVEVAQMTSKNYFPNKFRLAIYPGGQTQNPGIFPPGCIPVPFSAASEFSGGHGRGPPGPRR